MSPRERRNRRTFQLESLETRVALSRASGLAAAAESLHRATEARGRGAEVSHQRRGRGLDDAAGHNANDDRGGARGATAQLLRQGRGRDDAAGHNANDVRGRGRGLDDPAGHR